MCATARTVCIGVSLAALLTACSKPMSPVKSREGEADNGAATSSEWSNASVNEPQTARARLRFIGDVVEQRANFSTHLRRNVEFLVDANEELELNGEVADTVPAYAVLKQVRWRVEGANGPTYVVDNHPDFSLDTPSPPPPGTVGFPPGVHILRLRAPDHAGGGEVLVLFQSNFAPDMWWTGPDPARFPPSSDGDGRSVDVLDWAHFTTAPAWPPDGRGYFGPDSFQFLPHTRRPVNDDFGLRTFYELWGNRIYARSEGDAVHLGAWVVFETGGFDPDSPYALTVSPGAPTVPPGYESQPELYALLTERGLIGSPVGVRDRVPVRLANGQVSQPSETVTHPSFDVFSVFYAPVVASYWPALIPGKAYAIVSPVDGHGTVGRTREDLVALADRVDAGGGSDADRALRRRVLTFLVHGVEPAARSAGGLTRGRQP
jgi:hypothetical protein